MPTLGTVTTSATAPVVRTSTLRVGTEMYTLMFYGNDGEFSVPVMLDYHPVNVFRHPYVQSARWSFDGDCWYTDLDKTFPGTDQVGGYSVHYND